MGWIIGAIFDWFAVAVIDKLATRLPRWGCIALMVLIVGAVAALLWWIG
jgi:hypothetical protein